MSENDQNKTTQPAAAADVTSPATPDVAEVKLPKAEQAKGKPKTSQSAAKAAGGKPKAAETAVKAAETKPQTPPAEKSKYADLMARYSKLYPGNDTFHITTDSQVFLKNNLAAAQNHQRSLGEGAVTTIKVK